MRIRRPTGAFSASSAAIIGSILMLFSAKAGAEDPNKSLKQHMIAQSGPSPMAYAQYPDNPALMAAPARDLCNLDDYPATSIHNNKLNQMLGRYITSDSPAVGGAQVVYHSLGYVGSLVLPDPVLDFVSSAGSGLKKQIDKVPSRFVLGDAEIRLRRPDLDVGNVRDMEVSVEFLRITFGARSKSRPIAKEGRSGPVYGPSAAPALALAPVGFGCSRGETIVVDSQTPESWHKQDLAGRFPLPGMPLVPLPEADDEIEPVQIDRAKQVRIVSNQSLTTPIVSP